MNHTGFSKRIHRSSQLTSLPASAVLIKLIPNWLLWISVQTCQEEEEEPTAGSHSSLSQHYYLSNYQCKEEGTNTQLEWQGEDGREK